MSLLCCSAMHNCCSDRHGLGARTHMVELCMRGATLTALQAPLQICLKESHTLGLEATHSGRAALAWIVLGVCSNQRIPLNA